LRAALVREERPVAVMPAEASSVGSAVQAPEAAPPVLVFVQVAAEVMVVIKAEVKVAMEVAVKVAIPTRHPKPTMVRVADPHRRRDMS
jgi:hypothetical protein